MLSWSRLLLRDDGFPCAARARHPIEPKRRDARRAYANGPVGGARLDEVIRIVIGIAGFGSIYLIIRGFMRLSEARDPLAPLRTYDRTKDYGSNYAG